MRPVAQASACVFLLALLAHAQPVAPDPAMLGPQDVNQLCGRLTELMEAGGVAISELQRAAAPVLENVKGSCVQLRIRPGGSQPTYVLLMNLRAYLPLADTVPMAEINGFFRDDLKARTR